MKCRGDDTEDGADMEEGGGVRDNNGMQVGKGGGIAWPTRPHLAPGLHPRARAFLAISEAMSGARTTKPRFCRWRGVANKATKGPEAEHG